MVHATWSRLTSTPRSLSRTGFLTRLKGNKVGIDKRKTSRVIIREKLSKRAVVKKMGSDGCIFKRGD